MRHARIASSKNLMKKVSGSDILLGHLKARTKILKRGFFIYMGEEEKQIVKLLRNSHISTCVRSQMENKYYSPPESTVCALVSFISVSS